MSRTKIRAVTHADLAPKLKSTVPGSKTGAFLIVLTILCGLLCFVLCLIAEATRSQVTWEGKGEAGTGTANTGYECVYGGSGKTPLVCGAIAFLGLAVAMVAVHVYLLISVSTSPPAVLVTWDPDSLPAKTLTCQAGFFFVSTWICFAVGEILLLIGLSVESGHLKNWSKPRTNCLVIRQGVFSAAGVFSLLAVFLASGLYLTALQAHKISQELETSQREMLETSALYASPPRSPSNRMATVLREGPLMIRESSSPELSYIFSFTKHTSLIV